ncbi:T9SS type A sorting domain-containing protein [Salibacteraceae bacterium]|nr:T9SS type A sorting domain-containing protein [Salibacteraceae bacterium]
MKFILKILTFFVCVPFYSHSQIVNTFTYSNEIDTIILNSGTYEIEARGGRGGNMGGLGAKIIGEFIISGPDTLLILAGGQGATQSNNTGGGGGGSFVWSASSNSLMIAAGGGGGRSGNSNGSQGGSGSATTSATSSTNGSGNGVGGSSGAGGNGGNPLQNGATYPGAGGGGAGWISNGGNGGAAAYSGSGGVRALSGGAGGSAIQAGNFGGAPIGGFGGGGGGGGVSGAGGGGGGYNGGGGGNGWSGSTWGSGGGGGSYNSGTNQSNTAGFNSGNGLVTITQIFSVAILQDSAILCFGDSTAVLSATISGGTAPYTYLWNTGATTSSVSGLFAGTYSVTVTDNNSATLAATFLATEPTALIANIDSQQNVVCLNDSNGYASIDVSGGTAPYTYLWGNGSVSFSTSTLASGAYSVSVGDANGCEQIVSNTIIVLDSLAPNAVAQNLIIYLDASGSASITAAQVDNGSSDNCSVDSLYLDQSNFDCSETGVNVVTLTAVDPSGNSSSATADITVLDTISPTMLSQNLTVYLDASGSASITAAQVDNGSSDNCSVDSLYLDQSNFDCSETGVNVVTLTAVDPSGNSSSATADITVLDTISPTMLSQNLTVYLDASGSASITAAQVDNGSSDNCSVDISLSQSDFTCMNEGSNTVAMIGVDPSGNTTIDSIIVEVVDTLFEVSAIQGTVSFPQGAVHSYYVDSIAGAVYQWSAVNGTLSANGASAEVTWSQDSLSGQITVIQTVEQGCLDSISQVITLWLTGIDNLSLTEQINLFPNPTRDKVNLSLNQGRLEQVEVRVYANDGRLVLNQSNLTLNQSNHEVDLSQFARGQYTIVVSQAGKANHYKVILN